jgi:hypothetical protein
MKPSLSILDNSFRYVPAMATSVSDTWMRFGWRPRARDEGSVLDLANHSTSLAYVSIAWRTK